MQTIPIEQSTRGFNLIFIHSTLDDSDLTPTQFRVLAHLSRRASGGMAWPSAESIAKSCHIHPDTVWDALKELTARKMITRRKRPGATTMWKINPPDDWILHNTKADPPESKGRVNKLAPTPRFPVTTHPSLSATKDIQGKDIHCTSVAVGVSTPKVPSPEAAAEDRRSMMVKVRAKIAEYPEIDGKAVAMKLQKHCDHPGNGIVTVERLDAWLRREWKAVKVRFNDPNQPSLPAEWGPQRSPSIPVP